jgi:hypothetical protein
VTILLLVGVHGFLERDAEFLAHSGELLEIFGILSLVLDFELDACGVVSNAYDGRPGLLRGRGI